MQPRSTLGSIAGGVFLIFLALGFWTGHFLPLLFVGLAFASLLGSASSLNRQGLYGGIQGFIWLLGLAVCFTIGFWPTILFVVGASVILGALARPIIEGLGGMALFGATNMMNNQQQPYQQPQTPYYQPSYEPYQQGYQPPAEQRQQGESYQEGGRQYPYPQEYEQPQAQYPQELPPQQQ